MKSKELVKYARDSLSPKGYDKFMRTAFGIMQMAMDSGMCDIERQIMERFIRNQVEIEKPEEV